MDCVFLYVRVGGSDSTPTNSIQRKCEENVLVFLIGAGVKYAREYVQLYSIN